MTKIGHTWIRKGRDYNQVDVARVLGIGRNANWTRYLGTDGREFESNQHFQKSN